MAEVAEIPWGWVAPITTALMGVTAVATWFYSRGGKEALLQQQIESTEAALAVANSRADKAEANYSALLERLHKHMMDDATAFAKLESFVSESTRSSGAAEARLTIALDNLGRRIDGMSDRMDKIIGIAAAQIQQAADRR